MVWPGWWLNVSLVEKVEVKKLFSEPIVLLNSAKLKYTIYFLFRGYIVVCFDVY
jgi:hypothetical protein